VRLDFDLGRVRLGGSVSLIIDYTTFEVIPQAQGITAVEDRNDVVVSLLPALELGVRINYMQTTLSAKLQQAGFSVTDATCPKACTPVSVRPDPITVQGRFARRESASSSTPWTVRWSGCSCHPRKADPSYWTVRRRRIGAGASTA